MGHTIDRCIILSIVIYHTQIANTCISIRKVCFKPKSQKNVPANSYPMVVYDNSNDDNNDSVSLRGCIKGNSWTV